MVYRVTLTPAAIKSLDDLSSVLQPRVAEALRKLADDARPPKSKKLEGKVGYRVAVGDYRVLYLIDDQRKVVTVYKIGHRREVYRD